MSNQSIHYLRPALGAQVDDDFLAQIWNELISEGSSMKDKNKQDEPIKYMEPAEEHIVDAEEATDAIVNFPFGESSNFLLESINEDDLDKFEWGILAYPPPNAPPWK